MCFGQDIPLPNDPQGTPLDMSMARQPVQIRQPNPFGMGPDFNDAPQLRETMQQDPLKWLLGQGTGEYTYRPTDLISDSQGIPPGAEFSAMNSGRGRIADLFRKLGGV